MKFFDRVKIKSQLKDCDYIVAKLAMIQKFSGAVMNDELTKLLDEYMANPCFAAAIKLIEYDNSFYIIFYESRPNGFYARNINFLNMKH